MANEGLLEINELEQKLGSEQMEKVANIGAELMVKCQGDWPYFLGRHCGRDFREEPGDTRRLQGGVFLALLYLVHPC